MKGVLAVLCRLFIMCTLEVSIPKVYPSHSIVIRKLEVVSHSSSKPHRNLGGVGACCKYTQFWLNFYSEMNYATLNGH